jgi:hypothetical protein
VLLSIQGFVGVERSKKRLKCRRSRTRAAPHEHPVKIRHLRDVVFKNGRMANWLRSRNGQPVSSEKCRSVTVYSMKIP